MAAPSALATAVEEAKKAVPSILRDVKPDVLASSILPTLQKPWSDRCQAAFAPLVGKDEEPTSVTSPSKRKYMRADHLPLLQEDQYVVCKMCRRTLLLDVFEEHARTCSSVPMAMLPGDELRAGSPAGGAKGNNRAKSTSPIPPGSRDRPPSAAGSGGGGQGGAGGAAGSRPPKVPKRGTPPAAHGAASGAKGAEARRLQFERGELTMDEICGVQNGEKMCMRSPRGGKSGPRPMCARRGAGG